MSACPSCGGRYLYGLTWKHTTACPLYERDSATAAADFERRGGIREMTESEAALTAGAFEDPPEGWTSAVRFEHRGIHWRNVVERDTSGHFARPATLRGEADA